MSEVTYSDDKKKAYFNGKTYFLRESQGYYYNSDWKKATGTKSTLLHRMVWIYHYGEIKNGYHVHHKDHDLTNNEIENLECIRNGEHSKYHRENMTDEQREKLRENIKKAQEVAPKWHKSKEGREWHKQHFENVKQKMFKKEILICTQCGKKYEATLNGSRGNKHCSGACSAKARRESGIDNEIRICIQCGAEYEVNKYRSQRYCSIKCVGLSKRNA